MVEQTPKHKQWSVYFHPTGGREDIVEADVFFIHENKLYFYNYPLTADSKPEAVFRTWDHVVDYNTTSVVMGR